MAVPRVVVVGSTNMDMVVTVERIPGPGETLLGGEFKTASGGKGANQAVAAARLGADVTFVARAGADAFGHQAVAAFQAEGIDTSFMVRDVEAAHGVALILVDRSGENAIAVAPGANARLSPADVEKAEGAVEKADIVLLQLEAPIDTVCRAAELAKRHGKKVLLNPAPYAEVPDALLTSIDYLTPNETEAEMLLGGRDAGLAGVAACAAELVRRGCGCVVVTLGRDGVLVVTSGEEYHLPAWHVDAIDTTAAGDTFSAALAVGVARGEELREAAARAVAAASLSVTRRGAQPSLPTSAEVEAFLAAQAS